MSFGSPAADYVETRLDLNRLLTPHPLSTYYVRMDSNRLVGEGICKGDMLVVDRSLPPRPHSLVVFQNQDGFTAGHLPRHSEDNLEVWGIVTAVIRKLA